jgi:hypothetical protein
MMTNNLLRSFNDFDFIKEISMVCTFSKLPGMMRIATTPLKREGGLLKFTNENRNMYLFRAAFYDSR